MRKTALLPLALCFLFAGFAGAEEGLSRHRLTHDGLQRTYLRYVPPSVQQSDGPVQLVVMLHGGGGHIWPGKKQYLPEAVIGRTTGDVDANRLIDDFFRSVQ